MPRVAFCRDPGKATNSSRPPDVREAPPHHPVTRGRLPAIAGGALWGALLALAPASRAEVPPPAGPDAAAPAARDGIPQEPGAAGAGMAAARRGWIRADPGAVARAESVQGRGGSSTAAGVRRSRARRRRAGPRGGRSIAPL